MGAVASLRFRTEFALIAQVTAAGANLCSEVWRSVRVT
jgi:hypothetical protein